jgi:hypothetical protein
VKRSARVMPGMVTLALALALVVALTISSVTQAASKPTITGNAVVGATLTSSPAGDDGHYRWQRCDPAVATCDPAAPHGDTNWVNVPGAKTQSYVVAAGDLGFFVRVLAHDISPGNGTWAASDPVGPVTSGAAPPLPNLTPEHGLQVLAAPVTGSVEVKIPGSSVFTPLNQLSELPVGTVIDTRGSRVQLIAATGDLGSTTPDQSIEFYAGLFKITQPPNPNAPATAKLVQKLICGAASAKSRAARASGAGPIAVAAGRNRRPSPTRRKLWGSGSGGYRTSGRGSTGSVVGTTWLTKDTCGGTLTRVTEGVGVSVFDKKTKKSVLVGPGEKYFAG